MYRNFIMKKYFRNLHLKHYLYFFSGRNIVLQEFAYGAQRVNWNLDENKHIFFNLNKKRNNIIYFFYVNYLLTYVNNFVLLIVGKFLKSSILLMTFQYYLNIFIEAVKKIITKVLTHC